LHQELAQLGYIGAYSTLSDGLARYEMAIGNKKGEKKFYRLTLASGDHQSPPGYF